MPEPEDRHGRILFPFLCLLCGTLSVLFAVILLLPHADRTLGSVLGLRDFPGSFLIRFSHLFYLFLFLGLSLGLGSLWGRSLLRKTLFEDLLLEKHRRLIPVFLFLTAVLFHGFIEWKIYRCFPITSDEFSYLFQAKVFASGHITAPAHPLQRFFDSAFIASSNGRLFSIMPLGWPLIMALWAWLGIPWLANPLISSLSVVLLYQIGSRAYSRGIGFWAALLMALSPFHAYMSGTFFAHPCSLFLTLLALRVFMHLDREKASLRSYAVFGLLGAIIAIVHHFDVFLVAPLMGLLGIRSITGRAGIRSRFVLCVAVMFGVFLAFTLSSNHALTGSWSKVPYEAYLENQNFLGEIPPTGRLVGIYSLLQLKTHLARLAAQILVLNIVLFPLAPLFAFLPVLLPTRTRWDFIFLTCFLCMLLAYLFYLCGGGFQFGPRYYFPAMGLIYLLILRGFSGLHRLIHDSRWKRRLQNAVPSLLVLVFSYEMGMTAGTLSMIRDVVHYARNFEEIAGVFEERGVEHSLFFVRLAEEVVDFGPAGVHLTVRNDPFFRNENLTAVDLGPRNRDLIDYYPDRRYFLCELRPISPLGNSALPCEEFFRHPTDLNR